MASISDVLLQTGRDAAEGMRARGNTYGQLYSTLAQQIAALPNEVQSAQLTEQKRQQMVEETAQAKIKTQEDQGDLAAQNAFEAALQNPSNHKPDGTVDTEKVSRQLQSTSGRAWRQWQTISDATQKNSLEMHKLAGEIQAQGDAQGERTRKLQAEHAEYLGAAAYHASKLIDQNPNDLLHVRDTTMAVVARAAADGAITPQQARDFMQQTAGAAPGQMKQIFEQFITPDVRAALEKQDSENNLRNAQATKQAYDVTKPPTSKELQTKTVMLDGKRAEVIFDPNPAADFHFYDSDFKPISDAASRIQGLSPGSNGAMTADQTAKRMDIAKYADAIQNGTGSLAVLESTRGTEQGFALMAALADRGVDTDKLLRDWMGTKRAITSLNNAQQVRLVENITKATGSLDKIEELSQQWSSLAPRFSLPTLNAANLSLAKGGRYGKDAQDVANLLTQQIADVTGEIAPVIMGGNSPTEPAFHLAGLNLDPTWTESSLHKAVQQVRYNMNLAMDARNSMLQQLGNNSTQFRVPDAGASIPPPAVSGPTVVGIQRGPK